MKVLLVLVAISQTAMSESEENLIVSGCRCKLLKVELLIVPEIVERLV